MVIKMRLIDADALIANEDLHIVIGAGDNICIDIADIAKAPTISPDILRQKGRCKYCRGAKYTNKPFKVVTQLGREVDVQFNFCPNCGCAMEVSDGRD